MKTLTIMCGEKLWYLWEGIAEDPFQKCLAYKYPDEIRELVNKRLDEWQS